MLCDCRVIWGGSSFSVTTTNRQRILEVEVFISGASGFLGRNLLAHFSRLEGFGSKAISRSAQAESISSLLKASTAAKKVIILNGWGGVVTSEQGNSQLQSDSLKVFQAQATEGLVAGADMIIGIGTQAEYRKGAAQANPLNYEDAKLAASDFLRERATAYGVAAHWIRIFSIYGSGMDKRWLLPSLVDASASGLPLRLGPCTQKWGFLHVNDAAKAIELVVRGRLQPYVIDLGGEARETLRSQIESLSKLLPGLKVSFGEGEAPQDSVPNLAPLMAVGWRSEISLELGVRELIEKS